MSKLGFVFYGLNKLHCIVTLQNFSSKMPLQNFLFQLIGLGIWLNIHWLNSVTVDTPLPNSRPFVLISRLLEPFFQSPSYVWIACTIVSQKTFSSPTRHREKDGILLLLFRRRIPFFWDSLTKLLEIIVWTFVSRLGYFPCGSPLYSCNASLTFFRRWGRLSTSHLIPWQC